MVLHQIADQPDRHKVEHDRVDHFVGPKARFEPSRNHSPHSARHQGREDRQPDQQPSGDRDPRQTNPGRREGADVELPFRADVEQSALEGEGDGQSGKDQRGRVEERVAPVVPREVPEGIVEAKGAREQDPVDDHRILPHQQDDPSPDREGRQDREDRKEQFTEKSFHHRVVIRRNRPGATSQVPGRESSLPALNGPD